MIMIIISILVGLVTALWLYFEQPIRRQKQYLSSIPGPDPLPILGNFMDIKGIDLLEFFKNCAQKYGTTFKFQLAGRLAVIISDPKDIEVILRHNENLNKPSSAATFVGPWLGEGLLLSVGGHWKEMRKLITPTFHFNILEKFFVVMNEQADVLIDILKKKASGTEDLDIFPYFQLFALDVICETAMGTKIHAQTKLVGNDYVQAVTDMERIIAARGRRLIYAIPILYPFTELGRKQARCLKIIKETSARIIEKRRSDLIAQGDQPTTTEEDEFSSGKKRSAFLDLMLQARHTNGAPLTNTEISDEVDTFMFAGHDTTATQMSFLLYLLSKNPTHQEEIYKEQIEILGEELKNPGFSDVQSMHYLERAIKESQRLYGSVPMFSREVTHDIKLSSGLVLPKKITLSTFAAAVHRNPAIYPDPEKYDPDRFLPENVRERSPYAFVPFSAGPRNCIGQKFAMLEMKTCISKIIRNFEILPGYENGELYEPKLNLIILISAINGVIIRLKPRK